MPIFRMFRVSAPSSSAAFALQYSISMSQISEDVSIEAFTFVRSPVPIPTIFWLTLSFDGLPVSVIRLMSRKSDLIEVL